MLRCLYRTGSQIYGGEYALTGEPDLIVTVHGSGPEMEEWALDIIEDALRGERDDSL